MNLKAKATALIALVSLFATAIPATADTRFDRIEACDIDTWTIHLCSGETHSIIVEGDEDTDLDFWLFDDNGNLVDSDLDRTDYCHFIIRPRWSGNFTLKIKNHGGVYNRYRVTID